MSGILYEEEEGDDAGGGSDVEDVAELERILEEPELESQHEETRISKEKPERPKSAMSVLQIHAEDGSHRKKSIHWKDDEVQHVPTSRRAPGSACSARAPVPASAVVGSFRRSLKLLGLQPHEFGMEDEQGEPQPALRRRPPRAAVTTRLRARSVSLEDLRAAARDGRLTPDSLKDGDVYKMLSNAVYEEWYFRKQREELDRKHRQSEEERQRLEALEKRQADVKKRSQEKFDEWLQRKTQQLKQSNSKKGSLAETTTSSRASRPFRVMPEQAERAFQEWKRSKVKQQNAPPHVQRPLPSRHAEPDKQARREDAEKAYQMWKKRVEEVQQKEAHKKKRKDEELLAEKQRKEEEKRQLSRKSFEHWKTVKDEEHRKAEEKARRQRAKSQAQEAERQEQRQYEAQQAFLAWLDQVDEREASEASPRGGVHGGPTHPPLFSFRPARRHSCFT